ncbi:MAG: metallophosphoesterase family protein [Kiloniellaceae bacterium]
MRRAAPDGAAGEPIEEALVAPTSFASGQTRDPPAPSVPAGTRVYAIGDSHGCADRLRALHEAILEDSGQPDAPEPRAPRRVAVYLGDYVDRGPNPRDVLDVLIEEPLPGFESVHLLGNHDAFMAGFLEGTGDLALWMINGGAATLRSYGIGSLAVHGGAPGLRAALEARVPAEHRRFLRNLRLSHVEGDYLFVHAGIRPGVPLEAQDPYDLLWIREPFLSSEADHGKVVVHGHTPAGAPVVRANRIGIDTGACFGGRLTALVLEGGARRFLHA